MGLKSEYDRAIKEQKRSQAIPPLTCPLIDNVKRRIEESVELLDELSLILKEEKIKGYGKQVRGKINKLNKALDILEDIRDANDSLRSSSYNWYEMMMELHKEL